jgi:hypothetical protein
MPVRQSGLDRLCRQAGLDRLCRQSGLDQLRRQSGLDQLHGAEHCGDGIRVAGPSKDIDCGVSELDHVLVAVLDRSREGFPGCLRTGLQAGRGLG